MIKQQSLTEILGSTGVRVSGMGTSTENSNSEFYKGIYEMVKERKDFYQFIEVLMRELVKLALTEADGSQTRAARLLGVQFRQLRYLVDKYDIDPKSYRVK